MSQGEWVDLDGEPLLSVKYGSVASSRPGLPGQVLGWHWPWIDPRDMLPIERDDVLIIDKGYSIHVADYMPDKGFFTWDGAEYKGVRYWSNLPETPGL